MRTMIPLALVAVVTLTTAARQFRRQMESSAAAKNSYETQFQNIASNRVATNCLEARKPNEAIQPEPNARDEVSASRLNQMP